MSTPVEVDNARSKAKRAARYNWREGDIELSSKKLRVKNEDSLPVDTDTVAEALVNHGYDDWYIALLHTALGEVGDAGEAVQVANAAYEEIATDPDAPPVVEDTWQALGVTRAQALESFGLYGEAVFAQDPEAWEQFRASLNT